MAHYITTHNADGKAIVSAGSPATPTKIPIGGDNYLEVLYSTQKLLPSVAGEDSLETYNKEHTEGISGGGICPPNGASTYGEMSDQTNSQSKVADAWSVSEYLKFSKSLQELLESSTFSLRSCCCPAIY